MTLKKTLIVSLICYQLPALAAAPAAPPKKRHVQQTGTPPPNKATTLLPPGGQPGGTGGGSGSLRPLVRPVPGTDGGPDTGGTAGRRAGGGTDGGTGGDIALGGPGCEYKHPLETFVQMSSAWGPQAAPGGGVYFLSDLREVAQLYFLKSADTWPEQITFFPDGVAYFRLSPDGKKILVATHVGGDEQYDIHLVEVEQRSVTALIVDRTKRVESVAWGPKSDWFVFTSNERNGIDFDLSRYSLAERKAKRLAEIAGHNEVTDVSPDGKLAAVESYRSVADSDVWIVATDSGSATNLTKSGGAASYGHPHFSGSSQGLFYLSDVDRGFVQLYYRTLDGAKTPRMLTSGAADVESLHLDATRTSLAYVVNAEGYSRPEGLVIDKSGHKVGALVMPKLPPGVLRGLSFGHGTESRAFFYAHSDSQHTADVWRWKSPKSVQWTRSTQGNLRSDCFTREELVHYPSFDGRSIPAFLFIPPGTSGPVPFIVNVHGGPESQYRPSFSKISQYFLERGYGVFAPNIRGSTGYGREYHQLDNYKRRMDSVRDVIEGAKWLLTQGHARAGGLAISGGSYGGFLVLRALEEAPELFAAGAESVGITDFVSFLKNTKPYRRILREAEYGPLSDVEFLKSISPMTHLEKLVTPLLVFHGANDPRVPVGEAEQILKALQTRQVPVESRIFTDEGHGNGKMKNIMEQARTTVYFFEKYLRKEAR